MSGAALLPHTDCEDATNEIHLVENTEHFQILLMNRHCTLQVGMSMNRL